jgi:AcrR family transcriptional regulator
MTRINQSDVTGHRRRDAEDARLRLLTAADALFAERGYDRTTIRDIGSRAQIDSAMIARYFGSKSALYLAVMSDRGQPNQPRESDSVDLGNAADIERLVHRTDGHESGPRPGSVLYAVLQPHEEPDVQNEAMRSLEQRLVGSAEQRARAAGMDNPRLCAEVATAALIGILLSRPTHALPALSEADPAILADLLTQMFNAISTKR